MRGDLVISPAGEPIVLADIGLTQLHEDPRIRVWDVSLEPGACHPWHLHHNPYVVLSLAGSNGRMDWLDGTEPRFIFEYRGGAVYRPVSPVHRLTNIGDSCYRNRLIELKDLGEHLREPLDIGPGARSSLGVPPGEPLPDGRIPVLRHEHVSVWTVTVHPGETRELDLSPGPHLLAAIEVDEHDPAGGVRPHPGGPLTLAGAGTWFVVELSYLNHLNTILEGHRG
ncbi:hypothetical protein [Crossiella sp. S99.1]|uniref:hypothetical protein n=1 Tax=Crossiella sp. S99.1 TaxID=2936271 RepID=UPI001FFFCA21|nr:hypothetical protein [Crossiella sp. S99.1]MCK2258344.1 hypothetical protein [Crossiella sp. S99.1]